MPEHSFPRPASWSMIFPASAIHIAAVFSPTPGMTASCSESAAASMATLLSPALNSRSAVASPIPGIFMRSLWPSSAFAAAVDSLLTSIFQPVSFTASLTFCPFFPMARES